MTPNLPTRGWGPWRQDWYSMCSAHREPDIDCELCRAGLWRNRWRTQLSRAIFRAAPRLWRWWNR